MAHGHGVRCVHITNTGVGNTFTVRGLSGSVSIVIARKASPEKNFEF